VSTHSCDWLGCEPSVGLHANNDFGNSLLQEIEDATTERVAELTGHAELTEKQSRAALAELLAELKWRRERDTVVETYLDLGKGQRLRAALAKVSAPTPQWGVTEISTSSTVRADR
jgi:ABC-type glutathione transport system ATPase component